MNVNDATYTNYYANTASGSHTHDNGGTPKKSEEMSSLWNTTDTFEISSEAQKRVNNLNIGGEPDPKALEAHRERISYDAEDLAGLKERFAALTKTQKGITSKLQKLVDSSGIKLGVGDQLKVEIGKDGKAIVGGLQDAKQARKLEEIINKDESFVAEITDFQKEESRVSHELKSITGSSLKNLKTRIDDLQKGGGMDHMRRDGGMAYSSEQCIALMDQDLYVVDNEFGAMISEYYMSQGSRSGALGADISGQNDILENADDVLKKGFNSALENVNAYLADVNKSVRKQFTDPEELKNHLVSLKDIKISVDGEGNVAIEGSFNNNGTYDGPMKEAITKMFKEEFKANPQTGQKSDFSIAAQYLEGQYDQAFEGANKNRTAEVVYEHSKVESRISSPEEEAKLDDDIAIEAKAALGEMGVDASSLDIGVDKEGKITVANMPEDKQKYDLLRNALNSLNASLKNRSLEDYDSIDVSKNPIERLKGLLAKKDVFLPGGLSAR